MVKLRLRACEGVTPTVVSVTARIQWMGRVDTATLPRVWGCRERLSREATRPLH
jgi:hypothetical protein